MIDEIIRAKNIIERPVYAEKIMPFLFIKLGDMILKESKFLNMAKNTILKILGYETLSEALTVVPILQKSSKIWSIITCCN